MTRILPAAEGELADILKRLPAEHRERASAVKFRFIGRPDINEVAKGVDPDTITFQDRRDECVTIYLMNLFDHHGGAPGTFRHELRRCLLQSISDAIGEDWDLSD